MMNEERTGIRWNVIGRSVRGATHLRAGLPNQDAILWKSGIANGSSAILAVSDGHGSAQCFRSDKGAKLAVETALEVFSDFLDRDALAFTNLSIIKRATEEQLPKKIVRIWRKAVEEALESAPLSPEELATIENKSGLKARKSIEVDPAIAYGTTLLTVLVTETFILYVQIGDGDILSILPTGEVIRPLPRDERLFANETTSLCSKDAWRDFRVNFQVLYGLRPELILVSTDGFSNSFRDEGNFLKVGSDLLEIALSEGMAAVENNLESWLSEASQHFSGDDTTAGIVYTESSKTEGEESLAQKGGISGTPPQYRRNRQTSPSAIVEKGFLECIRKPAMLFLLFLLSVILILMEERTDRLLLQGLLFGLVMAITMDYSRP